jgi:predicted nucleotidyltransferase
MSHKKKLTRRAITQALADTLKPLDHVHAFYEGGAAAFDRIDQWSDIDLYVVVDDDKVNDAFLVVEKTLRLLSPIRQRYDVPETGFPGISQAFYTLENASEYLIIDLAVAKLSCPDKLLEPRIHGNNIFYFNKSDKVNPSTFDRKAFAKKVRARLNRLQARFAMFNIFVQKEINRGNSLEAIDLYHNLTLATIVEALRIKHNPFHYDFKMRYVHHELPPETIDKLDHLYFVRNMKDLQEKYLQANEWFKRLMLEIDEKHVETLVRTS